MVIWDRDKYIKEGLRQLSDNNFYIETESDLTSTHHREVVTLLDDMHSHVNVSVGFGCESLFETDRSVLPFF